MLAFAQRVGAWCMRPAMCDMVTRKKLWQSYWFPVYAYFRRRTGDAMDAQDLTQEFFTKVLEKNYLSDARPDRGRFRTFLLTAAQRFLSKEWAKSNALKRGGGNRILSLDGLNAADRERVETWIRVSDGSEPHLIAGDPAKQAAGAAASVGTSESLDPEAMLPSLDLVTAESASPDGASAPGAVSGQSRCKNKLIGFLGATSLL